jgi:hypothetical protein
MGLIKDKIDSSAGYERKQLPQIDFDDLQGVIAYLISKKIGIEIKRIPSSRIKFTQNEIDEGKVQSKIDSKSKQYRERLYFVSKGWFVLDGHHDLAHALKTSSQTKLTCFVCDVSIHKLIRTVNAYYEK